MKTKYKQFQLQTAIFIATIIFTGCLSLTPIAPETNYESSSVTQAAASEEKTPAGFYLYDSDLTEYDNKGQVAKEVLLFDKGEKIERTSVYEYNDANQAVKKLIYDSKNRLDDYEVYEYDNQGRLVKENEYRQDHSLKNYKIYEYSANSVVKKYYRSNGNFYRYTVKKTDANGNEIENSDYRLAE